MAAIDVGLWNEARAVLDIPDLPPDPHMLPRPTRVRIAEALTQEGWPQRLIGPALGVERSRISRWVNGDVRTWQQAAGRGPSNKPKRPAQPEVVIVEARPAAPVRWEADDDPETDFEPAGWWNDDDEDDEPEPAPRTRATSKKAGLYGTLTPIVVAQLRRQGHAVGDDGRVTRWATARSEPAVAATSEAPVIDEPELLRAPDIRRAAMAPSDGAKATPQRARAPGGASEARVRLAHCGHVVAVGLTYGVPGAVVVCTGGCPAATRRPVVAVVGWR